MNVMIEHSFCPYCEEVTNLYFQIVNVIFFQAMKRHCATAWNGYDKTRRLTNISFSDTGHIIFG